VLAQVWLRGGGRASFVAVKSSNRVLKWIQAFTEGLGSRLSKMGAAWRNASKNWLQGLSQKGVSAV